jgi:hypothetical protein
MIGYSQGRVARNLDLPQTLPVTGFEDLKETTLPRRIALVLALTFLSIAGFAQTPTSGNVFVGYSFNRASEGWSNTGNLNGWEVSAEGKLAPFAGIVADVGTQYGTLHLSTRDLTGTPGSVSAATRVETFMFGPRISVSKGKLRPFAQALIGLGHLHEDTWAPTPEYNYGQSSLADAIGGGIDYRLMPMFSWRVQGDLLQTRFHGSRQDDIRMSTGLVFKF